MKESRRKIKITVNAMRKIKSYAALMKGDECYGFLVCPEGKNDGIITDAVLAPGQRVCAGSADLSEAGASEAKAEIENMNAKALGFWHSHGNMGVFHSSTDNHNLEELLHDFTGNTVEHIERKRTTDGYLIRSEGNDTTLSYDETDMKLTTDAGKELPLFYKSNVEKAGKRIVYDIERERVHFRCGDKSMSVRGPFRSINVIPGIMHQTGGEGYAFSIVVNSRGDVYAELALRKWDYTHDESEIRTFSDIAVEEVIRHDDVDFTMDELKEEINRKIKRRGVRV